MTDPIFIGARIYRGSSYGPRHPLSIPRVPTVTDLCRSLGWLTGTQYRTSPCAKPSALTAFHTPRYIAALQRAEATQRPDPDHDLGTLSNPVFPEVYRRPATAAGGGLLAAEHVRNGGAAYNPGGGTHHGLPDRANGFCYINEPVLTIRHLLHMGLKRIAYVDIDAHHCDGVAVAFHGSDHVKMISVHEDRRWPFTGALDDDAFDAHMTERSLGVLGRLTTVGPRRLWPVITQTTDRLIARRTALVAEAAHVLPPIGAQGLNTSLQDIAALVKLASGIPAGLGEATMLDAYARERTTDIHVRARVIDLFNRVCKSDAPPIRALRLAGLKAVHDIAPVRRAVMKAGLGRQTT